jgi:hypothetical protein
VKPESRDNFTELASKLIILSIVGHNYIIEWVLIRLRL